MNIMPEETEKKVIPKIKAEIKKSGPSFFAKPLFWQLLSVLLIILFLFTFFYSGRGVPNQVSKEDARMRIENYVYTVLGDQQADISVEGITEENGMYKVDVNIQEQVVPTYLTKDGKLFFPNVVDLDRFNELQQLGLVGPTEQIEIGALDDEVPASDNIDAENDNLVEG